MEITNYKAGGYRKQPTGYSSFSPEQINHSWIINDAKLHTLLSDCDRKLGELNAFATLIPDVEFFIKMHIAKEATKSSRIEGTQTTVEESFRNSEQMDPEKRDDWQEVHNYISAMNHAIVQLEKLPLSSRLIKDTHKKLMHGVRGKQKAPGDFRKSQNWIGGATLKDAFFIPPHHNEVADLMSDLEKYLNNDDINVPHLVRIGIAHYQFETIHPFLDGNGRIGRLLITLYLVSNNILNRPCLYLSDFFDRNRQLYYDNLTIARTKNDMLRWLKFFLVGVLETAQSSIDTFNQIIKLKLEIDEKKMTKLGKRASLGEELMNYLYRKPLVDVNEIAEVLNVNITTANRLVQEMEKLGILKEKTGFKRNRVFVFEKYMQLFER